MHHRLTLEGTTSDGHEFPIFEGGVIHDPDEINKVKHVIQEAREDTEIFPHLNNFNAHTQSFDPAMGDVLKDPAKRDRDPPGNSCVFSPHSPVITASRSTLKT